MLNDKISCNQCLRCLHSSKQQRWRSTPRSLGRQLEGCVCFTAVTHPWAPHCSPQSLPTGAVTATNFFLPCFQGPAKTSLMAPSPAAQDMGTDLRKEAESQQVPTSEGKYFICLHDITVLLNNRAACCPHTPFACYQFSHHALSLPTTSFSIKSCSLRPMLFVAKACSMQTVSVCYQSTQLNSQFI